MNRLFPQPFAQASLIMRLLAHQDSSRVNFWEYKSSGDRHGIQTGMQVSTQNDEYQFTSHATGFLPPRAGDYTEAQSSSLASLYLTRGSTKLQQWPAQVECGAAMEKADPQPIGSSIHERGLPI